MAAAPRSGRIAGAIAAVGTLMLLLVNPSPTSAIVGGDLDGNAHPYVGLVVTARGLCTGTLVAPTIVLTAAHCVVDFETGSEVDFVAVTFDPDPVATGTPVFFEGTASAHPLFRFGGRGQRVFQLESQFDIAVIELDAAPGIEPAPLPSENLLAPFATGTRNRDFTVVGYGLHNDADPPTDELSFDAIRRNTTVAFKTLTDTQLYVRQVATDNHAGGGGCFGDSGGPILLGDTVVGEYTQVSSVTCQTWGAYTRIDVGTAREFLGQYVA